MNDYTTFDKVMIVVTAVGNLGALIFGIGSLVYLFGVNRKISQKKKPRCKSKFSQKK